MPAAILDFSKLRTPGGHCDTLVAPEPASWAAAVQFNERTMRSADAVLLGRPLPDWRRITREIVAGSDERPVVVTGHQPGFFHPGVWAKHIVATRFAEAIGGTAIDLVVDNDAAKETALAIPTVRKKSLSMTSVPFANAPAGWTYEQIPRRTAEELRRSEQHVRKALGERYPRSQMPAFMDAASAAPNARDWVDQIIAGRRAIESQFGVELQTQRVSELWSLPFVADLLIHAPRFSSSYNNALAAYRRANGVRSRRRPIPDLLRADDRYEVPLWAHRAAQPRRRVFVSRIGDTLRVFADNVRMGQFSTNQIESGEVSAMTFAGADGWMLRPRALTLTMWARLLLADLFIHGIGGAKYDRISDTIMDDYYGVTPPQMVCVSATLHLDLPTRPRSEESIRRLRHSIRDMTWNPQRHLQPTPEVRNLIAQRAGAVRDSIDLRRQDARNRDARREVFERIRGINSRLLEAHPAVRSQTRADLTCALEEIRQNRISRGREYFFGLCDRPRLELLMSALPGCKGFGI